MNEGIGQHMGIPSAPGRDGAPKRKDVGFWMFVALILATVWVALSWYGVVPSYDFPASNPGEWQAVFLTNNQVYFGHLVNYNKDYVMLRDIYYLRVAEPLQQGSPPQPTLNLVKLGGELHGPQDMMYVPKDKIMFWESMKSDSQVVQAIQSYLASLKP